MTPRRRFAIIAALLPTTIVLWIMDAWLWYVTVFASWAAEAPANPAWQREAEVRSAWAIAVLWCALVGSVVLLAVCAPRRGNAGFKCSACGYDRSGLASGTRCPECGGSPEHHHR